MSEPQNPAYRLIRYKVFERKEVKFLKASDCGKVVAKPSAEITPLIQNRFQTHPNHGVLFPVSFNSWC
jgi:hypothetical protein